MNLSKNTAKISSINLKHSRFDVINEMAIYFISFLGHCRMIVEVRNKSIQICVLLEGH